MTNPRCPKCGLPILEGAHTHQDGQPPVHGWCCPTCTRQETP